MDLPRYCGGKRSPKKSPIPPLFALSRRPAFILKPKIRNLAKALDKANVRKRIRLRVEKKPIQILHSKLPCARRYLEALGLPCSRFSYSESPALIEPNKTQIFEVRTGILPFASFTSALEAQLQAIALRREFPQAHAVLIELT